MSKEKREITCRNEGVLKFTSDTLRRRRPVPPPPPSPPPPSKFRLSPRCATKTARRRESSHRNLHLLFSSSLLCNTHNFFFHMEPTILSSAPPNRCVYDRAHSSISSAHPLLFRSVLLTWSSFKKKKKEKQTLGIFLFKRKKIVNFFVIF